MKVEKPETFTPDDSISKIGVRGIETPLIIRALVYRNSETDGKAHH